jgi:16S rRNA (adenine1518-N6/adenine1519-N6)-dimethyltransferase
VKRIAALAVPDGGSVIELGAGLGALTRPLLERAVRVIAVERDRDLVPALRAELADAEASGKLVVLEADAKTIDVRALLADQPRPHVLCGNLPYQITGPLLELSTRAAGALDRVVFLVQLEVAARLVAAPGSAAYGALSVFVQAAFEVTRPLVVRSGAFYPPPKVDSAVVVLTPRAEPTSETPVFAALVRAAFEQRRKKLSNAWRGLFELDAPRLAQAARDAGVDLESRGERLGVAEFSRMASAVERVLQ